MGPTKGLGFRVHWQTATHGGPLHRGPLSTFKAFVGPETLLHTGSWAIWDAEGYGKTKVTDQSLKHTLEFGIGIHHAGLPERDRKARIFLWEFMGFGVGSWCLL